MQSRKSSTVPSGANGLGTKQYIEPIFVRSLEKEPLLRKGAKKEVGNR